MPTNDLIQAIRRQGRTLAYLARELEMDPSLLRKKLLGQRRPFTEAQARHLRAILGVRLEDIPYIPDDTKAVAFVAGLRPRAADAPEPTVIPGPDNPRRQKRTA